MYDDKLGLRNDALVTIGEVHLLRHDFDSAKDQFEKCLSLKNDRDMIIAIAATYIRLGFTASPLKKSPKWTNLQIPPESLEFEKW